MAASLLVDSNWSSMGMVLLLLGNNSRKASNSIHIGSQTILYSLDATLCHVIRNPYTLSTCKDTHCTEIIVVIATHAPVHGIIIVPIRIIRITVSISHVDIIDVIHACYVVVGIEIEKKRKKERKKPAEHAIRD